MKLLYHLATFLVSEILRYAQEFNDRIPEPTGEGSQPTKT